MMHQDTHTRPLSEKDLESLEVGQVLRCVKANGSSVLFGDCVVFALSGLEDDSVILMNPFIDSRGSAKTQGFEICKSKLTKNFVLVVLSASGDAYKVM